MTPANRRLHGMTAARWNALSPADRAALVNKGNLTAQLLGLDGWRVEVVSESGVKRRFIVGRSTGWVPCHLEIYRRTSSGGIPAEKSYKSVRPLYRVRGSN